MCVQWFVQHTCESDAVTLLPGMRVVAPSGRMWILLSYFILAWVQEAATSPTHPPESWSLIYGSLFFFFFFIHHLRSYLIQHLTVGISAEKMKTPHSVKMQWPVRNKLTSKKKKPQKTGKTPCEKSIQHFSVKVCHIHRGTGPNHGENGCKGG